jgi:hypothetical protein
MHDVTVSAAVTSFEFLVSEIFNGNTPPKTYTCQKSTVSFTLRPFTAGKEIPRCALNKKLGGTPQLVWILKSRGKPVTN